jgi:hypothetical protein
MTTEILSHRLDAMEKKQDEIGNDIKEVKTILVDADKGLVVRITRLEVHHKVFIGIITLLGTGILGIVWERLFK